MSNVDVHPVVEVRCRRGHRRSIHPGEIADTSVPLCMECPGPLLMFPVEARSCFCDWTDPHAGCP